LPAFSSHMSRTTPPVVLLRLSPARSPISRKIYARY
jgi:hypothetical protein